MENHFKLNSKVPGSIPVDIIFFVVKLGENT